MHFEVQGEEVCFDVKTFIISSCTCMHETYRGNKDLDTYSCRHREAVRHWLKENIYTYLSRGKEAVSYP